MHKIKQCLPDKIFDIVNMTFLVMIFLLIVYPLYVVLISSVSSAQAVNYGQVKWWPVNFSLQGFKYVFQANDILAGYRNTIIYTFFGTLVNLFVTLTAGYSLSRRDLKGRRIIITFFVITMYFNGGLVPFYMLVRDIGLYNTPWIMILLNAVSVHYLIITRSFYTMTIPHELFEAASIDGCSDFKYFTRIVLPLSKALISVLALYFGVLHWNNFWNALLFLSNRSLFPLQVFLRNILLAGQNISTESGATWEELERRLQYAETIKYGLVVVASFPILVIYPFFQRYFVRGIMIGSLKG